MVMTSRSEVISKVGHEAFELIWNNTNDAIFTIGYDGAVLTINRAFTRYIRLGSIRSKRGDISTLLYFRRSPARTITCI